MFLGEKLAWQEVIVMVLAALGTPGESAPGPSQTGGTSDNVVVAGKDVRVVSNVRGEIVEEAM